MGCQKISGLKVDNVTLCGSYLIWRKWILQAEKAETNDVADEGAFLLVTMSNFPD